MADRYWVGGTGNWSDTSHWSTSNGGGSGASVPTATDNAYFTGSSDSGAPFTVTISTGAVCASLIIGDGTIVTALSQTMTLAGTVDISIYGSLYYPATKLTLTFSGAYNFLSTASGNTITTNGVAIIAAANQYYQFVFNGSGGDWTLGSALTLNTNQTYQSGINVTQGTLKTGNYNVTCRTLASSGTTTRGIELGSSTVTTQFQGGGAYINFTDPTNLSFNAGTSLIVLNNISGGGLFAGGGQTFYNLQFTNVTTGLNTNAGFNFSGANTFNNFTINAKSAVGVAIFGFAANQTINGTLTVNSGNTDVTKRIFLRSDTVGTARTLTVAAKSFGSGIDFGGITVAGGSSPWDVSAISGGNCGGNTNITFAAGKVVYWNLAGSQNWSATGWATTNNGAPAAANFPLAQDTATFTEAGSAGTVTINGAWNIGVIQMADGVSNRTTAFTLATGTNTPTIYGNVTLFSSLTLSGTGAMTFAGQGTTQTITSAGITFTQPITVNSPSGTFKIADNFTQTSTTGFTLTAGTVDVNSKTLTCYLWSSSNSNTRSILFGTGKITATGNGATVWSHATATGFTYTGTPNVTLNYSGATGTRTIVHGTTGGTETNAMTFNVTAGTDTVATTATSAIKTFDFTGFAGTLTNTARNIYGNVIFVAGMTITAGANTTTFAATSGTQQITTAGKTLDFPLTFNGIGGTFAFQDALTQGSTRAFTVTNGTVQLKAGVTSTVGSFATSGSNQKYLQSTLDGTKATLSQANGTISASYLTIKDISATGGATWNAYVSNSNVDAGNNLGWNFDSIPVFGGRGLLPAMGFGFTL